MNELTTRAHCRAPLAEDDTVLAFTLALRYSSTHVVVHEVLRIHTVICNVK